MASPGVLMARSSGEHRRLEQLKILEELFARSTFSKAIDIVVVTLGEAYLMEESWP